MALVQCPAPGRKIAWETSILSEVVADFERGMLRCTFEGCVSEFGREYKVVQVNHMRTNFY